MPTRKAILKIKKSSAVILNLLLLLSIFGPAVTRADKKAPLGAASFTVSRSDGPADPAEMEAFLDDLFASYLEEYHIAGAAVAVVKDGKLFFTKGYGYADLENQIAVDPEQTIFRIGSVGKVITWTAVMQLVEQGKLDLEQDINTYLDFPIPDTYPQPITLRDLMAHTSGIEDRWLGSVTEQSGDLVSEREWLIDNFPGRVRPPGEAAGYSNYNAILAGYIVAQVSGRPYDQYVHEHIFDPLGMTHSNVHPQVPEDLRPYLSKSYTYANGVFQPFPDYLVQPAVLPSGFHQASVTDMARFMIARLNGGFYADAASGIHILEQDTAQQMLTTLYTPDPRLRGTAYGLFDFSDNGQWVLGHTGYAPVMHSELILLPDQQLGVFVVFNSNGARDGGLSDQHMGFQRAFFDHYFPATQVTPVQPQPDAAARTRRFAGYYRDATSHSTTPEKVQYLFGGLQVIDPGDGTLLVPLGALELRFIEVEPLYFRQVDGPFSLVFREDENGHITYAFTDIIPQYGFVKLNWYETPIFNMVLAQICVLTFLSMLPVTAIRLVRMRRSGSSNEALVSGAKISDRVIQAAVISNLLFLIGLAIWFRPMRPSELHDLTLIVESVMALGVLAAVLAFWALVSVIFAWVNRYWGLAYRSYFTLATFAAVAFVWFLYYWNWLGWRY